MLHQIPIQDIVLEWSFEKLCYYVLESTKDNFSEYPAFHDHALYHRSLLVESLKQKRPLFAPVMATLQSLASSLTVYQHDWAYFNQLLMGFSAFFQEDILFYEQFEQQMFVAGARQTLDIEQLPFVSALMNLWALQEHSPVYDMLHLYAVAQVDMPAAVAGVIGLMSSRDEIADWAAFMPWVEHFSSARLEATLLKELSKSSEVLGFVQGPLRDPEKYWLGKHIAEKLSQSSEVFYPVYQSLVKIEDVLQTKGYSPKWEIYPIAALHSLGLYPNWIAPWMALCKLPMILAQYRLYEQKIACAWIGES